jgi:L-threonylcarbamoyladenylate synthase
MGKIVSLEDFDLALKMAKEAIKRDGLIIYPTDTVYGIGCSALSKKAVEKVYSVKGREKEKPLSIIVSDIGMISQYCHVGKKEREVLERLLPGPYTLLLKKRKDMPAATGGKIGIRMPEHFFIITVARQLGVPIVTTSANKKGKKAPVEVGEIDEGVKKAVAVIVDGGRCRHGKESTIIDLVEKAVLRKGAVKKEEMGFEEEGTGGM